jgi:hypothetical protein
MDLFGLEVDPWQSLVNTTKIFSNPTTTDRNVFNIWGRTTSSRTLLHGVSFVYCATFLSFIIYVPPSLLRTVYFFRYESTSHS